MSVEKRNVLTLLENGQLKTYLLDDQLSWEVGRESINSNPDIKLRSITVSRKHGKFQNINGNWLYVDYNGKNGTVYNNKKVETGLKGKIKPIILNDGDVLVFGGGDKIIINTNTVFTFFSTKKFTENWDAVDTKGLQKIELNDGCESIILEKPEKGEVINNDNGVAIYMGDVTYLSGNMNLMSVK